MLQINAPLNGGSRTAKAIDKRRYTIPGLSYNLIITDAKNEGAIET